MILVDSSAWIEFQRGTASAADRRLVEAIRAGEQLATVGIVLLEILAGARSEVQADELRRLLGRCHLLRAQEPFDYEAAAAIYRTCRQRGAAVRRLPDCLIAAIAIRTGARLLHQDADFETIARLTPLTTVAFDG